MQSFLRGLLFDDCVSSLATSKKDKALGRKLKTMLVPHRGMAATKKAEDRLQTAERNAECGAQSVE